MTTCGLFTSHATQDCQLIADLEAAGFTPCQVGRVRTGNSGVRAAGSVILGGNDKEDANAPRSAARRWVDAWAAGNHPLTMSAQEIIAELPKLKPDELRLVKAKVDDLAKAQSPTIGKALLEFAGTAEGLPAAPAFLRRVLECAKARDWPADYALNHAHYNKGEPKR